MDKLMRYYWLKLRFDFYENPEIQWLLSQDNGAMYIVMYQKLCIEAARKATDTLIKKVADFYEPYSWEDLARMTGCPLDTVRAGMVFLVKLNLVRINEDRSIFIPHVKKMVGSEKEKTALSTEEEARLLAKREKDKLRKRKSRAKKKLAELQASGGVGTSSPLALGFNPKGDLSDLIGHQS